MIDHNTTIEELVDILPESVTYLMKRGVRCIRCGEPIWDTLENAAREKGFTADQIESIVEELNSLLKSKD